MRQNGRARPIKPPRFSHILPRVNQGLAGDREAGWGGRSEEREDAIDSSDLAKSKFSVRPFGRILEIQFGAVAAVIETDRLVLRRWEAGRLDY